MIDARPSLALYAPPRRKRVPPSPFGLRPDAAAQWARLAPLVGRLTVPGRGYLHCLCLAAAYLVRARRRALKGGRTPEAMAPARDALRDVVRFARLLSIDPADAIPPETTNCQPSPSQARSSS